MKSECRTSSLAPASDLYHYPSPPMLVVLSGPSGVGKDTLLRRLKERGYDFAFVVTMTTRPKREDEVDGVDYIFVSKSTFADMMQADELLEHSLVYGDYKGIPKQQVRDAIASGKDVMMRIDVQGAAKIRKIIPNAVTIFLAPESEAELIRRLTERKTESPDGLKLRIATAREEMKRIHEFDYVVVNRAGRQDEAVDQIVAIVTAERCRVGRKPICL
ncbi:MAG: guanylate kinase [Anaerolineae bacterium]|nr:guanylate kinase [Candidatus Roseilinea sp.]MDW8450529.1 guanylate kinase [Anaerolineae bacterium]